MKVLDNQLLVNLLHRYADTLKDDPNKSLAYNHAREQIELLTRRHLFTNMVTEGGQWLASSRDWMLRHGINGDSVTWGSNEELRLGVPLTPRLIEELAGQIATVAINEFKGRNESIKERSLRDDE